MGNSDASDDAQQSRPRGWSRLRDKLGNIGRNKEQPLSPEESEKQIDDFLRPTSSSNSYNPPTVNSPDRLTQHAPLPSQQPTKITNLAPKLDIDAAKPWAQEGVNARTGNVPPHDAFDDMERWRPTKPPRRLGLTVIFSRQPPEIIGHGGDETENPTIEISMALQAMLRQRAASISAQQSRPTPLQPSAPLQHAAPMEHQPHDQFPTPPRQSHPPHPSQPQPPPPESQPLSTLGSPLRVAERPPIPDFEYPDPSMRPLRRTPTGFATEESPPQDFSQAPVPTDTHPSTQAPPLPPPSTFDIPIRTSSSQPPIPAPTDQQLSPRDAERTSRFQHRLSSDQTAHLRDMRHDEGLALRYRRPSPSPNDQTRNAPSSPPSSSPDRSFTAHASVRPSGISGYQDASLVSRFQELVREAQAASRLPTDVDDPFAERPSPLSSPARPASLIHRTPSPPSARTPPSTTAPLSPPSPAAQQALTQFTTTLAPFLHALSTASCADPRRPSTRDWVRCAHWWLLHGRTTLQQALAVPPPRASLNPTRLAQAHADVAKAWWVASEPLAGQVGTLSARLRVQDAVLALAATLAAEDLLPDARAVQTLVRRADDFPVAPTALWLAYPLSKIRGVAGLEEVLSASSAPELDDGQEDEGMPLAAEARAFVPVSVLEEGEAAVAPMFACLLSVVRRRDGAPVLRLRSQTALVSLDVGPTGAAGGVGWEHVHFLEECCVRIKMPRGFRLKVRVPREEFAVIMGLVGGNTAV